MLYPYLSLNVLGGYFIISLSFLSLCLPLIGLFVFYVVNPIISVLYLISLILFVSFYLYLLGLTYLAIIYITIYVGAVSILFLFIVMLINVRVSELLYNIKNGLALLIIIALLLWYILPTIDQNNLENSLALVIGNIWDGNLWGTNHIVSIGNIMYSSYSVLLIVISIILLLAMVGTIAITKKPETKDSLSFSILPF
jgi:NADH-ubiquinone oxidoreductase chain 6